MPLPAEKPPEIVENQSTLSDRNRGCIKKSNAVFGLEDRRGKTGASERYKRRKDLAVIFRLTFTDQHLCHCR